MKRLTIPLRSKPHEVIIGRDLLGKIGQFAKVLFSGSRCAIIADATVAPLFGEPVQSSLQASGFRVDLLTIPSGEGAKSIAQAGALCEQMNALGLDRTSFLVSLGGGVVSDLAGFVAAIYFRGIPYISVPTTLLAQVDSCIGGKTGVNSGAGKNLIGAFHHPALVVVDVDTLRTLPERIWNEGFAEIIKHGVIHDAELFALAAQPAEPADLAGLVERNLALKGAIVAADEHEQTDVRALLNFGHTVGHAIEHAAGPGGMLHGEALSLGLIAAARVSVQRAGLSLGDAGRIRAALAAHRLPTELPADFSREKIFAALARDKKFENGRVRFIVAHEIGRASVSDQVTLDDLQAAVAEL